MGKEDRGRSNERKLENRGTSGHHGQTVVGAIVHAVPLGWIVGGPSSHFCPTFFVVVHVLSI